VLLEASLARAVNAAHTAPFPAAAGCGRPNATLFIARPRRYI
jgi:hypothetical protein